MKEDRDPGLVNCPHMLAEHYLRVFTSQAAALPNSHCLVQYSYGVNDPAINKIRDLQIRAKHGRPISRRGNCVNYIVL